MGTALDRDIATALASGTTARERIDAFLALDPTGRRGAPALRERQGRAQARLSVVSRARYDREHPRSLPYTEATGLVALTYGDGIRLERERYYRIRSQHRRGRWQLRKEQQRAARRRQVGRRLTARYTPEVERRGGEIDIVGQYDTETLSCTSYRGRSGRELCVLQCDGWRQYSRRYGASRATLAYLCGHDDSGDWAVRVPGTLTTVADALEYVEPASVRAARERGRTVLRQGDVYAVQTSRVHDGLGADGLERHSWDAEARVLSHPEHAPLSVGYPARFVPQRVLQMGRGAGHGAAD